MLGGGGTFTVEGAGALMAVAASSPFAAGGWDGTLTEVTSPAPGEFVMLRIAACVLRPVAVFPGSRKVFSVAWSRETA